MELFEIFIFASIGIAAATSGALMGVGGGFMMVPVFVFMGFNDNYGTNLLAPVLSLFVIIFVASSATVKYGRVKMINYRLGLIYAPFSIIGTRLGVFVLGRIGELGDLGELIFNIIFSALIIVIGVRLIYRQLKRGSESEEELNGEPSSYYWLIILGMATGFAASLVGIGGGLIAVPVIYFIYKEKMHVAIATSLFIMIFTSISSTIFNYFEYMDVLDMYFLAAGLLVAAGALIGAQIGSWIQTRLKGGTLQLVFGFFMIGVAIPLLWLGP